MDPTVRSYPLDFSAALRYVVCVARAGDGYVFCRHRQRSTWECPGGHIEPGETPEAAMRRELYEETGAAAQQLEAVCIYGVTGADGAETFGVLYRAQLSGAFAPPHDSEIAEARMFSSIPEALTYPHIIPWLVERAGLCVLSLRQNPAHFAQMLAYIQSKWASEDTLALYEDCLIHALDTASPLPDWYVLMDGAAPIGCAGLITNDFISRMDLYPWLCALYVQEERRGQALGSLLIDRVRRDAAQAGFDRLYLCTDHIGYYEKYGFVHIGTGYHPWGESSRIYEGITKK